MQHTEVNFKVAVGRRIRRQRQSAGMTQEALSHQCGIYRTYLSRIEAGAANPTLVVLAALAAALKVPLSDLFMDGAPAAEAEAQAEPEARAGSRPGSTAG